MIAIPLGVGGELVRSPGDDDWSLEVGCCAGVVVAPGGCVPGLVSLPQPTSKSPQTVSTATERIRISSLVVVRGRGVLDDNAEPTDETGSVTGP